MPLSDEVSDRNGPGSTVEESLEDSPKVEYHGSHEANVQASQEEYPKQSSSAGSTAVTLISERFKRLHEQKTRATSLKANPARSSVRKQRTTLDPKQMVDIEMPEARLMMHRGSGRESKLAAASEEHHSAVILARLGRGSGEEPEQSTRLPLNRRHIAPSADEEVEKTTTAQNSIFVGIKLTIANLSKKLDELIDSCNSVGLNPLLASIQLATIRDTLEAIRQWRDSNYSSLNGLKIINTKLADSLLACSILTTVIDLKLKKVGFMSDVKRKANHPWREDILQKYRSKLDKQVVAFRLLLSIFRRPGFNEQIRRFERSEIQLVFDQVRMNTAVPGADKEFETTALNVTSASPMSGSPTSEYQRCESPPLRTLPTYTADDVAARMNASLCWVTIDSKVYDITDFANSHPGGRELILAYGGQDVSAVMRDERLHKHSENAYDALDEFLIGFISVEATLKTTEGSESTADPPPTPALVAENRHDSMLGKLVSPQSPDIADQKSIPRSGGEFNIMVVSCKQVMSWLRGPSQRKRFLTQLRHLGAKYALTFANILFSEVPVAAGHIRIRWTCSCGRRLYDDFLETRPGAAKELEAALDSQGEQRSSGQSSASSNQTQPVVSVGTSIPPAAFPVPGNIAPYNPRPMDGRPTSTTITCGPESNWLLVCAQAWQRPISLLHLSVCLIRSDRELFVELRQRYTGLKKAWWSRLSMKSVRSIRYVQVSRTVVFGTASQFSHSPLNYSKFELHPKDLVDVRKVPDMPPASRKEEYLYQTCDLIPPIGENLMTHLFHHPHEANETAITLIRSPKKRKQKLAVCAQMGTSLGWGIHLVEGWAWTKIWLSSLTLFLLSSLVFAISWSVLKHDLQGAFGVAAYFVALVALGIGTVQAYINQA
ncbi:MAG: hypothetical protein Q9207_006108 [Kuettlingeria erythrocarpa]